jgi:hypothetical protein
MRWMSRHSLTLNRIAGVTLVVLGLLVFTGRLGVLGAWLTEVLPSLSI